MNKAGQSQQSETNPLYSPRLMRAPRDAAMTLSIPEKTPAFDQPLGEAIETIEKLLALCSKHGLKREAYSIALGEKITEPPKRQRGRPLVKNAVYRRALAGFFEIEALKSKGVRGARVRVARMFAEADGAGRKDSPTYRKRVRQIQNDLSRLTLGETVEAAYYVRRIRAGEALDTAKARLDAAMGGKKEAQQAVLETLADRFAQPRFSQILRKASAFYVKNNLKQHCASLSERTRNGTHTGRVKQTGSRP
ncbi:MAG TPA: hypothetical protein VKG91_16740 [Roseiarcus sp.]|nr:hypothetical protein [Roseiarcus sp.]